MVLVSDSDLRRAWIHVNLPGVRVAGRGTYREFPMEELPSIPIVLDDQCEWLKRYGSPHNDGLHRRDLPRGCYSPEDTEPLAEKENVTLPADFRCFMTSKGLQQSVRSATDCYLTSGKTIAKTRAGGRLLYFLSDQQGCVNWYLHIQPGTGASVLASGDLFCLEETPEQIDFAKHNFTFCAPTFSEFLYRFWIENEIWFAMNFKEDLRPLKDLELAYVRQYQPGL